MRQDLDRIARHEHGGFVGSPLGASDLRGGIDTLLALVLRAFREGAPPRHAYVYANRRADRLKVLLYDGTGM